MNRTASLLVSWLGLVGLLSAQVPAVPLHFDATTKQVTALAGQTNSSVTFTVSNRSTVTVVIHDISLSCGCSEASLPSRPWTLKPGSHGPITITTDLRGKSGSLLKSAMLLTSHGTQVLNYQVDIPEPATPAERARNQSLAKADRQAVFRGDCARCHVEPAKGKTGSELFMAACGICHETEHRASMVPDLKALQHPMSRDYWLRWISNGKVDTLMPGFSAKSGGPLSDEQIRSLADFLSRRK